MARLNLQSPPDGITTVIAVHPKASKSDSQEGLRVTRRPQSIMTQPCGEPANGVRS
jgi:hypothetical protein